MANNKKISNLSSFTDILSDESCESQPFSLSPANKLQPKQCEIDDPTTVLRTRPAKHTGQYGDFRSVDEIDEKYRCIFTYPFFNLVQSKIIEDALYSDKSMVVCAPTGSGKTVVFEMAILELLMKLEDINYKEDFKIIYMAPVKAVCTERLMEWHPKFTQLGLHCIEVTGDTDVDFSQLKPYRIIITTPEKWDILTRRWKDYRGLVGVIKLFLIDEVHILNDENRGPVLEAVVSRMKTIESSSQSAYRIERLQKQIQGEQLPNESPPRIRFVAVSATVSNPEDVAAWLGNDKDPAVYYKFGDECRPVKLRLVVEGYPCPVGTSIFKFDINLNYKLWPIIHKYYDGKPTLIFCNTRKGVVITAETLSKEMTIHFNDEQKARLTALASTTKNKKLQALLLNGVGCHHAGLLFEERVNIERAFRQRDLPILITTTTLAMGVNLPAHLVIVKNTQYYVNGAYQEYSISTVLQMVGRAGRPQFDNEATAVIMTRQQDKARYQALVGGSEPLQSYLHKRLTENLNSEAALQTVTDVAQCVQWLSSTFLYVRAAKDPRRYLGLPRDAAPHLISKKVEELCVKAMNGLASSGLITMDEACCIQSTEAGKLMSMFYLDFETMKLIMKIKGTENLEQVLQIICECHELADMHLRIDERRCLNTLNRSKGATIRFPMKGKITTRQMKLSCVIQAILGCLPIPDPSLNQEATKIMRIAERVCKCMVAYVTRPDLISQQPQHFSAILNTIILAKCIIAHLWENSPYVSKQLRGIGPTFSTLLTTAGKSNFMLLEESHPRDLERIMNKGPPAGNVLRKQVSLLPKYQLTMTPIDEMSVTVQLLLLNRSFLKENINQLTAGDNHSSYIIAGDSENHILLLTMFKDKNLISVYDGTITYTITRKHRFEHKIFVTCISSSYVGIDVQSDYLFKDLDPGLPPANRNVTICENLPTEIEERQRRKDTKRQTNITDTFKERKRKANEINISQSKEKKRKDNALIEKFKILKESFGIATKLLQDDIKKSEHTNSLLSEISNKETPINSVDVTENTTEFIDDVDLERDFLEHCRTDSSIRNLDNFDKLNVVNMEKGSYIDDGRVESILKEIENEMSENVDEHHYLREDIGEDRNINCSDITYTVKNKTIAQPSTQSTEINSSFFHKDNLVNSIQPNTCKNNEIALNKINAFKNLKHRYNNPSKKPDNYRFLDLLEKKLDLSDDEVVCEKKVESELTAETKYKIQQYWNKLQTEAPQTNTIVIAKELLESPKKNDKNCHPKDFTEKQKAEDYQNFNTEHKNTDNSTIADISSDCVIIKAKSNNLQKNDTSESIDQPLSLNENMLGGNIKDNELPLTKTTKENNQEIIENDDSHEMRVQSNQQESRALDIIEDKIEEIKGLGKEQLETDDILEVVKLVHCLSTNAEDSKNLNIDTLLGLPDVKINTCTKNYTNELNNIKTDSIDKKVINNNYALSNDSIYDTTIQRLDVTNDLNVMNIKSKTNNMVLKSKDNVNNQKSSIAIGFTLGSKVQKNDESNMLSIEHNLVPTMLNNNDGIRGKGLYTSDANLIPFNYYLTHGNSKIDNLVNESLCHKSVVPITTEASNHKVKTSKIQQSFKPPFQGQSTSPKNIKEVSNSFNENRSPINVDANTPEFHSYETNEYKNSNDRKNTTRIRDCFEPPFRAQNNSPKNVKDVSNPFKEHHYSKNISANRPVFHSFETNEFKNSIDNKNTSPNNNFDETVEYIKKYSYTTTEIDIWTKGKDSDKCTLQVTKRLKVDLDITLAQEKTNTIQRKENQEQGQNNNVDVKNNTQQNLCKNMSEFMRDDLPKNVMSNEINNKPKRFEMKHFNTDNNKKAKLNTAVKRQIDLYSKTKENNITTERNDTRENDNDHIIICDTTTSEKQASTPSENCIKTSQAGKCVVKTILQKYTNNLKQNTATTKFMKTEVPSNESKSHRVKSTRPLKIPNIHSIDASIKSLVADITPSPSQTISPAIASYNKEPDGENRTKSYQTISAGDQTQLILTPPTIQQALPDIPKIVSPHLEAEELESDFNIDRSMLDPKAVLQCYINKADEDSEIIPPPSQFCSDGIYSPPNNDMNYNDDLFRKPGLLESNYYNDLVDFPSYRKKENSIFEYNDEMELTPSKEIETWTLSTEDQVNTYGSPRSNSNNSFTFMKQNLPVSNANHFTQPKMFCPRPKLDQFKFIVKRNHQHRYEINKNFPSSPNKLS